MAKHNFLSGFEKSNKIASINFWLFLILKNSATKKKRLRSILTEWLQ